MNRIQDKIGFLITSPNWAGAENALKNIVKSLSKIKVKSVVYCNQEIYNNYKRIKGVKVYNLGILNIKSKFRYLNYLHMYLLFKKILIKEKPLALFLFLDASFFIGSSINKKYSFPIIVNLRGEEIDNFIKNKSKLTNFFLKKCLNNSPKIVSVARHQAQNLPEKYRKKIVIIPNGIDANLFKPLKKIQQKKNAILFVGRIKKEKGINEILSVAKQLPQYEFWFAGQGKLEKEINLPNTRWLGNKNGEELIKLYNQATICVLPSYHEGFSNVGLEALSCGKAFIGTPDFEEYIEKGKDGIIIPAKDENALKNAIFDLMTDEKKRKMLEKNARKKALQYSWNKVAKKYLEFFKESINEGENEKN